VMKLIEIAPVDYSRNCSESADVKLSPSHIKVCAQYLFLFYSVPSGRGPAYSGPILKGEGGLSRREQLCQVLIVHPF